MARADAIGLFWEDRPVEKKAKKEKIVRVPPEPVWLNPEYLPNLDEACAFRPDLFTDEELVAARFKGERLIFDIECNPNSFLAAFRSIESGKSVIFEMTDDGRFDFSPDKLQWVMENFLCIGFNIFAYDNPIIAIACGGADTEQLWRATQAIIQFQEQPWRVVKKMKGKKLKVDHIDLIELTALAPGLKKVAGRLHATMLMDLPFPPGCYLTEEQRIITKWYCFNDLDNTELLYKTHIPNIELRIFMGKHYNVDLRSKSDAQMAEAIFVAECKRMTGQHPARQEIQGDRYFNYRMPSEVTFQTTNLEWVRNLILQTSFYVDENGRVQMPENLEKMVIPIGGSHYKFGIGGLHSQEKCASHIADEDCILFDLDVASYYPKMILQSMMSPPRIGSVYREIYQGMVTRRLAAKKSGDTTTADGLKIAANGSFGKTLDPYSCLYYPEMGIQTTISGQLKLLMLIERFELNNINVVNANTDGIIVKCLKRQEPLMYELLRSWENETLLEMERTDYKAVYSRDVNNYFAFKKTPKNEGDKVKAKGVFGDTTLKKNATTTICSKAAVAFIIEGTPVETTIKECTDIREFVAIREATRGGVKVYPDRTEYLGKTMRWYYSTNETGEIVNAKNGHKVADSEGARPCMRLPTELPNDIDYDWYIAKANTTLQSIGVFVAEPELETT